MYGYGTLEISCSAGGVCAWNSSRYIFHTKKYENTACLYWKDGFLDNISHITIWALLEVTTALSMSFPSLVPRPSQFLMLHAKNIKNWEGLGTRLVFPIIAVPKVCDHFGLIVVALTIMHV